MASKTERTVSNKAGLAPGIVLAIAASLPGAGLARRISAKRSSNRN